METLIELSQEISSSLEMEEVLNLILNRLGDVVKYDSATIQLLENNIFKIIACAGFSDSDRVIGLTFPCKDTKFPNYEIYIQKNAHLVGDVRRKYPHFIEEAGIYHTENIRSWMGIPLIHRGKVIGMISLDSELLNHFTQDMASLAMMFASHCANAITNAQLFKEKKQSLEELNTLYRASHEITSELDLKTVLKEIVIRVHELSGSDLTGVVLVDELGRPIMSVENENIEPPLHLRIRLDGITHEVFNSGESQVFDSILTESDLHNLAIIEGGFRSYAGFPIKIAERVKGILYVHSYHPSAFTGKESLLQSSCKQASIAIKNAELYFQVKNQAKKSKKLVEISEELLKYKKESALLKYCVNEGVQLFNSEDCSISLKREDRNTIDLVASSGIPPEVWLKRDAYLDRPGLTAYVFKTGRIENFGGDEYKEHIAWAGKHEDPFLEHLNYLPSGKCNSLLIGPLKDGLGNSVGVLKVENHNSLPKDRRFSEFEIQLFNNFATIIGLAIERSRLVNRLDEEARKEARLSLGGDLHRVMNMTQSVIALKAEKCKELVRTGKVEHAFTELEIMRKAAKTIFSTLRWIVNDLKGDPETQNRGLMQQLEHLGKFLQLPFTPIVKGRGSLPQKLEDRLYKIGAEALYNICKHARVDDEPVDVEILLEVTRNQYRLEISDQGKGFDIKEVDARTDNFGLNIIRYWAKDIGAYDEIYSEVGKGTRISVVGEY
jgi:GAF domain-containing protein